MLIEFNVANHRSFKENAVLSLVASSIKDLNDEAIFEKRGKNYLKLAVLYGANGSGKSNLLDSIVMMRSFVINSSRESQADEPINVEPFLLDQDSIVKPSLFEVVFIIGEIKYRYGFEVNRERVVSEWLFETKKVKETVLFTRELDDIQFVESFKEGERLEEKTRRNALFLSVVAQFNGEISTRIVGWFRDLNPVQGVQDEKYFGLSAGLLNDEKTREFVTSFMKSADMGIIDMRVEEREPDSATQNFINILNEEHKDKFKKYIEGVKNKKVAEIMTTHEIFNNEGEKVDEIEFTLTNHESSGTNKFFNIIGAVIKTLINGEVLIIDELNARLHPLLTRHIVKTFNSLEGNPNKAQLIFTTHDTNLLDREILRRDQIYFTEKDQFGASHLFSLVEYKPRNDEAYEKNYIKGKYGAIPFVGGLDDSLIASL